MANGKSSWREVLGRKGLRRVGISILVAISFLRVDSTQWLPSPKSAWVPYAMGIGSVGRFILQDGSRVDLNTGSKIEVRFAGQKREIVLTRGEALFTVVHRSDWPFAVRAGGVSVHSAGTKFSVRLRDDA